MREGGLTLSKSKSTADKTCIQTGWPTAIRKCKTRNRKPDGTFNILLQWGNFNFIPGLKILEKHLFFCGPNPLPFVRSQRKCRQQKKWIYIYFSLSLCSSFLKSSSSTSLSSSSSLLHRGEWLWPWLLDRWADAGVLLLSSFSPSFPRDLRLSLLTSGDTGELSVRCSSPWSSAWVTEKRPIFLWVLRWPDVKVLGRVDCGTGVTWWHKTPGNIIRRVI